MQAKIHNNLTHFTVYIDDVEVNTNSPIYSQVQMDLSKINDGEYTFEIYNNNNQLVSRELMRIGDFELKTKKKYTQYVRK